MKADETIRPSLSSRRSASAGTSASGSLPCRTSKDFTSERLMSCPAAEERCASAFWPSTFDCPPMPNAPAPIPMLLKLMFISISRPSCGLPCFPFRLHTVYTQRQHKVTYLLKLSHNIHLLSIIGGVQSSLASPYSPAKGLQENSFFFASARGFTRTRMSSCFFRGAFAAAGAAADFAAAAFCVS